MAQVLERQQVATKTWLWLTLGVVCSAISALCFWYPLHIIRPFRPQQPEALQHALWVHDAGPWISALCALLLVALTIRTWKTVAGKFTRIFYRIAMIALCLLAIAGACMTHVNIYEAKMFHSYASPAFGPAGASEAQPNDMVIAVNFNGHARAYPILTIGYHHIINDTVGEVPIAVTYCTLCHTGIVWDPVVDGKRLHLRLAGINNGNALLRDEETGSVWQQSTGEAIFGPLKGRYLNMFHSSELTFALWHKEHPQGDVLKPDARWVSEYDSRDWEKFVEKTPVMVDTKKSGIPPHQLMLGVAVADNYKAFPIQSVLAAKLIQDNVAEFPILLVVAPDGASIRVFDPAELTFTRADNNETMQDTGTGSHWNSQGCAVDGALTGRCLKQIDANKTYWFDWMNHHPKTAVYKG